jgi:cytochrome c-type biogenesis protein CcmE
MNKNGGIARRPPMTKQGELMQRRTRGRFWPRNAKFLVGGAVVALVIAYLMYSALPGSTLYYMTVSELKGMGPSVYGEQVRVSGKVQEGSVQWDNKERILRFSMTDETNTVPVVYKGIVPDAFRPGGDVVVEGKYDAGGVFLATSLIAKCPSKFIPST